MVVVEDNLDLDMGLEEHKFVNVVDYYHNFLLRHYILLYY
jgi:hypothetical protein